MAETSWPSTSGGRVVTDDQYEDLFGPQTRDGVVGTPADAPLIYADDSGMQVKVRPDRVASLRGHGWASDAAGKTLPIGANSSGQTRTDLIVMRLTRATWDVTTEVRAGTPGAGAPSPVTDASMFEMPLADVAVYNGDTSIGPEQVTPRAWYIGPSGQILCTSKTRPPHEAGLRIYETDTARELVSTGTAWVVTFDDSGVVSASLGSGWSATINSIRRRAGLVTFNLTAHRDAATLLANGGNDRYVGTVPEGFRPADTVEMVLFVTDSGVTNGAVYADGRIVARTHVAIPQDSYVIFDSAAWHAA